MTPMPGKIPMRASLAAMMGWAVLFGAAVGAAGAYPTALAAGAAGLRAQAVAAGIVVLAMAGSAVVTVRCAAGGPARAACAFVLAGTLRVLVVAALTAVAWKLVGPPPAAMIVWVCVFYVAMLAGEAVWLTQALKQIAPAPPACAPEVRGGDDAC